jgi:hypothetical protein
MTLPPNYLFVNPKMGDLCPSRIFSYPEELQPLLALVSLTLLTAV